MAHHFSPIGEFARRSAPQAIQHCSSGFALTCFRVNGVGDIEESDDQPVMPFQTAQLVEVLENIFMKGDFEDLPQSTTTFLKELAVNPDARIRKVAVALGSVLDADAVRKLSQDPVYEVREALSLNEGAIRKLTAAECLAMASDTSLIEKIISTVEGIAQKATKDAGKNYARESYSPPVTKFPESASAEIGKLKAVVDGFKTNPDYDVQIAVANAEHFLGNGESFSQGQPLYRRIRQRGDYAGDNRVLDLFGNPGDYAFAVVHLDEEAYANGIVRIDASSPRFLVPVWACRTVINGLTKGPFADAFLTRFAANTNRCVREAVAGVEWLPKAALDKLKSDSNYRVRSLLLQNDSALASLSDEEILQLIKDDSGLLRDAFEYSYVSNRMSRLLHDAFQKSKDPSIQELLESLDK